jgi:hypothetical protein
MDVDAVGEFWAWWEADAAGRIAQGAEGYAENYVKQLGRRIARIDPGLAWELGPGTTAEHELVIFPDSPEHAALARRVLKAAPAPDRHWEYADARQAAARFEDLTLGVGGEEFAGEDFRIGLMRNRYSADISVYHPKLARLPEGKRLVPVAIMLDHAIGQQDVNAWIGIIEPVLQPHPGDIPLGDLPAVVQQLRAGAFDGHGEPIWEELHGRSVEDRPISAYVQVPLVPAFWPDFDQHVAVQLGYAQILDDGLPGEDSGRRLQAMEQALAEALNGNGRLVAAETTDGRRILHFYVDSTTSAGWDLEAAAAAWEEGQTGVGAELDPEWSGVNHLRIR